MPLASLGFRLPTGARALARVRPSRATNQFAAVRGRNSGSCARGGGARRAHGGASSAPVLAAVSVTAVIAASACDRREDLAASRLTHEGSHTTMITALVLDAWLRAPPPRMAVGDVRPRGRVGGVVRAAKQLRAHTPARLPPTLPERRCGARGAGAARRRGGGALDRDRRAGGARDADAVDARSAAQLVRELNQLLRELGDQKRLREAERVFRRLVAAGLQPTQVTYGTLVSRAGAAGRCDLAVQFYRDALHRGVSPDVQTCNSLINAFAKAADAKRAASVVKSMRRRSLRPTLVTYNSLLDAAARAGILTLADEALG